MRVCGEGRRYVRMPTQQPYLVLPQPRGIYIGGKVLLQGGPWEQFWSHLDRESRGLWYSGVCSRSSLGIFGLQAGIKLEKGQRKARPSNAWGPGQGLPRLTVLSTLKHVLSTTLRWGHTDTPVCSQTQSPKALHSSAPALWSCW